MIAQREMIVHDNCRPVDRTFFAALENKARFVLQYFPEDEFMQMMNEFLNAYTFAFCEKRGFTKGQGWRWSLAEMARTTGCNAVILPVCAWQEHPWSTKVDTDTPDVISAEDVAQVCALARELGLRVILKAMVNCRDGYWRAYIHFFDNSVQGESGLLPGAGMCVRSPTWRGITGRICSAWAAK